MIIKFSNRHIFFALADIWRNIDYKFKFKLNQLVVANPEESFIQELEISEEILIQIFSTVTVQPEGVSAAINREMQAELLPQLEAASNLSQADTDPDFSANEAGRILIAINDIKKANNSIRDAKIEKGRSQILEQ